MNNILMRKYAKKTVHPHLYLTECFILILIKKKKQNHNENDVRGYKNAADFGWFNNEYKGNLGSIQLLVQLSDHVRGFDYGWIPFKEAAVFTEKTWHPIHINHHKGDISPGVITINGKQILGKTDVRNEKDFAEFGGKENILVGPAAASNCIILCRRAKPRYKFN